MAEVRTYDIIAKRKRRYRQAASASRRTMAIVRAYQKGDAASAIGRRFGISANAVYQTIGRLRRKIEDAVHNIDGGTEILRQVNEAGATTGLDQIIKGFNLLKKYQDETKKAATLSSARPASRKR